MKLELKLIGMALLCLTATQSVFAGSFARGYGSREEARAARRERDAPPPEPQAQPAQQAHAVSGVPLVPGAARGEPGPAGTAASRYQYQYPYQEPLRRMTPRMSAEERRALRRQINEAGHDIYAPAYAPGYAQKP